MEALPYGVFADGGAPLAAFADPGDAWFWACNRPQPAREAVTFSRPDGERVSWRGMIGGNAGCYPKNHLRHGQSYVTADQAKVAGRRFLIWARA